MLSSDTKACNIKAKTWVKAFFTIQVIIIILIIAELSTPKWVYLDSFNFEGGVIMCYEGCSKTQTYKDFYDDNCGSYKYNDNYESNSPSSVCDLIDNLSTVGTKKLILDIVSIVAIIIWSGTMFCLKRGQRLRNLNSLCAFLSLVLYISGTASWLSGASVDFSNCGSSNYSGTLYACVSHGPKLGIAIMAILILTVMIYSIVTRMLNAQFMVRELKKDHGVHGNVQVIVGPVQNQENFAQPAYPQPLYSQPMPGQPMYPQPMYIQPMYPQPMPGQPMYPQPIYNQPMNPQPVNSQMMYAQAGFIQPVPPVVANFHNSTNIKGENNDETDIANNKH